MPVFFVQDVASGIVTPLDKKFRIRDIQATEKLSETPAIHNKIQSDANEYPSQHSPASNEQREATPPLNQNARQSYQQAQAQNEPQLGKVKDIMSSPVLTIPLNSNLSEAWKILQKYEIHHLAIIDQQDRLCGLLSEKSIPNYLMNDKAQTPANTPLDVFCGQTVLSTGTETRVNELASALLENGLDGVPVTENGQLVGLVTRSDILKVMLKSRTFEIQA